MSSVIVGGSDRKKGEPYGGTDWSLLVVLGFIMAAVGTLDLVLLFVPQRFGVAEWEFTTASQFATGMPVATMGLGLLAFAGRAVGSRVVVVVAAVGSALFVLALVAMGGLFALAIPLALKSGGSPIVMTGIKKAILKGSLEMVCYMIAHGVLAAKTVRSLRVAR